MHGHGDLFFSPRIWIATILGHAIPSFFILRRIGVSKWWTLLAAIPAGPAVLLWLLAFWIDWPTRQVVNAQRVLGPTPASPT